MLDAFCNLTSFLSIPSTTTSAEWSGELRVKQEEGQNVSEAEEWDIIEEEKMLLAFYIIATTDNTW